MSGNDLRVRGGETGGLGRTGWSTGWLTGWLTRDGLSIVTNNRAGRTISILTDVPGAAGVKGIWYACRVVSGVCVYMCIWRCLVFDDT